VTMALLRRLRRSSYTSIGDHPRSGMEYVFEGVALYVCF